MKCPKCSYEKKNSGPSKEAFTETKKTIRIDASKDPASVY